MRKTKKFYTNLIDKDRKYITNLAFKRQSRTLFENAAIEVTPLTDAQKAEVDEFYMEHFGQKVPYSTHELLTSFTGVFDVRYIPMEIYYSDIEYTFDSNRPYIHVFENKNLVPYLAKAAGVKTPDTIWDNVDGLNFDGERNFVSRDQMAEIIRSYDKIFVKPSVGTSGGTGCKIYSDIQKENKDTRAIVDEILAEYKANFIVQDVIKNCESLRQIHPYSLNTSRLVTYIVDGQVKHMPGILRVGRNKMKVDNLSAGGILASIDDNGQMGDYTFSWKYDFKSETHPDTGFVFKDGFVKEYPKLIEAAEKMHRLLPNLKIVNWDFTIDDAGDPVLIEINGEGGSGFEMVQIGHAQGAFGDDTAHVLEITRDLNKLKKVDRDQAFALNNLWN